MKIFIGQAVTGEDKDKLKDECKILVNILGKLGHEVYCTILDDELQKNDYEFILNHAFKIINEGECVLAIVRSEKKSEGLLMELGYCLAKNKKIILAINKQVKDTFLREIADEIIEFKNIEDLLNKLKKIK